MTIWKNWCSATNYWNTEPHQNLACASGPTVTVLITNHEHFYDTSPTLWHPPVTDQAHQKLLLTGCIWVPLGGEAPSMTLTLTNHSRGPPHVSAYSWLTMSLCTVETICGPDFGGGVHRAIIGSHRPVLQREFTGGMVNTSPLST